MSRNHFLLFLPLGLFIALGNCNPAQATDPWAGSFSFQSSRDTSVSVCAPAGQGIQGGTVTYDSWSRTRAAFTNLCFEVYSPGITDQTDSNPASLNVFVNAPNEFPARFVRKNGSNFVYLLDLRSFDPVLHGVSSSGNTQSTLTLDVFLHALPGGGFLQSGTVTVRFTQ